MVQHLECLHTHFAPHVQDPCFLVALFYVHVHSTLYPVMVLGGAIYCLSTTGIAWAVGMNRSLISTMTTQDSSLLHSNIRCFFANAIVSPSQFAHA